MAKALGYTCSAVMCPTVQLSDGAFEGTGLLVLPDEALTALHLVWTTGISTATNFQVSPGSNNGAVPCGTFARTVTHHDPINGGTGYVHLGNISNEYALPHPFAVDDAGRTGNRSDAGITFAGSPVPRRRTSTSGLGRRLAEIACPSPTPVSGLPGEICGLRRCNLGTPGFLDPG